MSKFKLTDYREKCISVAALVSDIIVDEGYLSKDEATLIFDALAEGLIQQDVSTAALQDIEALLMARIDEPGSLYSSALFDNGDPGDESN